MNRIARMSEKEQFNKLHGASLEIIRKSVPWLIVSWMTKAYGETQLFSHSETLGSSSHLLHYFQGTTFCILAETKLQYEHNTFASTCVGHAQPKCIAGEHSTGAIFCNTENMYFPIVLDHRTAPLQSAEAGRCRYLFDVL